MKNPKNKQQNTYNNNKHPPFPHSGEGDVTMEKFSMYVSLLDDACAT